VELQARIKVDELDDVPGTERRTLIELPDVRPAAVERDLRRHDVIRLSVEEVEAIRNGSASKKSYAPLKYVNVPLKCLSTGTTAVMTCVRP